MSDTFVLDIREITNVALAVFSAVMTLLFVRYVLLQWCATGSWWRLRVRYQNLSFAGRGAIGFSLITCGEFARASIVWEILHYARPASYLTQAPVLILSLLAITVGSLCCIRVFSPVRWGHWPWIIALLLAALLSAVSTLTTST